MPAFQLISQTLTICVGKKVVGKRPICSARVQTCFSPSAVANKTKIKHLEERARAVSLCKQTITANGAQKICLLLIIWCLSLVSDTRQLLIADRVLLINNLRIFCSDECRQQKTHSLISTWVFRFNSFKFYSKLVLLWSAKLILASGCFLITQYMHPFRKIIFTMLQTNYFNNPRSRLAYGCEYLFWLLSAVWRLLAMLTSAVVFCMVLALPISAATLQNHNIFSIHFIDLTLSRRFLWSRPRYQLIRISLFALEMSINLTTVHFYFCTLQIINRFLLIPFKKVAKQFLSFSYHLNLD